MNLTEKYGQRSYTYLLEVATPVRGDEEIRKLEQDVKALMPGINELIAKLKSTSFSDKTKDELYAEVVAPINTKLAKVVKILTSAKKKAVSVMKTAVGKILSSDASNAKNPGIIAMRAAIDASTGSDVGPENKQMAYRFKLVNDTLSKMTGVLDRNIIEPVMQSINQYLNARSAYTFFNTSISQIRRIAFADLADKTSDSKIPPNEETEKRINAEILDAKRKSQEKKAEREKADRKVAAQERGISRRHVAPEALLKDVKTPKQAIDKLRKILSYHSLATETDTIESKLNQLQGMLQENPALANSLQNPNDILQNAIESIANDRYLDLDELKALQQKTETLSRSNPGDDALDTFNRVLWDIVRDGNNINTGATMERVAAEPEELATSVYQSLLSAIRKSREESWDETFSSTLDEHSQEVLREWTSALGDSFGQFSLSDIITQAGKFKNRETIKPVTAKFFMLCMLWAIEDKKLKREAMKNAEKRKYERKHGPDLITAKLPESCSTMTFMQYITESDLDNNVPDYDHPKISVGVNAIKAIRENKHPNRNERIQEIADFAKKQMSYGTARRLAVLLNQIAYSENEREADGAYKNFQKLQRQWEATERASKIVTGMGDDAKNRDVFNDYLKQQWYVPSKEEGEYHNAMIRPLYVGGAAGYTKEEIDILKNLGEPIISGGTNVFVKSNGKTYRISTTFDHSWLFVKNTANGTIAISTKEVPPTTEGDVRFEYTRGETYSPAPTKRENIVQMPPDVGVVWLPYAERVPAGLMNGNPSVKLAIMPNAKIIEASFMSCPKLKSIELDVNKIEKISKYAFYGCPVDFPPVSQDVVESI